MNAYFLTGTDTGVGKTFISCALLRLWQTQGFSTAAYKPVAAGAEFIDGQWSNEDARHLQAASSVKLDLAEINPVCLREPIAPHLAAQAEGRQISPAQLHEGFAHIAARAERVIVEGVGGFRVPLSEGFDSADLAQALGLPIILVVGLRLGCLNHALLTAEAIHARGLNLVAWVGNSVQAQMPFQAENLESLQALLKAPCLGLVPPIADRSYEKASAFLNLTALAG